MADFIAAAGDGKKKQRKLGLGNVYEQTFGSKAVTGQLRYKGNVIHTQVIQTDSASKPQAGARRTQTAQ